MRVRPFFAVLVASLAAAGCGSTDSTRSSDATGGGGGAGPGKAGDACSSPIVLTDAWMGTHDFTEPFEWGDGTAVAGCESSDARPAVFLRWTADHASATSFKVLVDGSESVVLEVFDGADCSGTPKVCTDQKIAVGAEHVAGAYVPVMDGDPISVVVVAKESSAPGGDWTISMGD